MFSSSLISSSTSTPTSTSTLTSLLSSITTTPAFPIPPSLETYEWNISAHSLSFSQVLHPEETDDDPLLVETEWNKLIADHQKDLVCLLSLDGIILRVSTSSSLSCDPPQLRADQLVGLNIAHVIHVNDLPAFYDQLNLAVNEGKISSLAHLLRSKNPPNRDYVGLESTLSLYSFENAPVGESPCILMLSKLTEATETLPSEENALSFSKNDSQSSRLQLDLRNEAEQLRKQLASLQEELEALRQERNGLSGTTRKKKRQLLDLTCEECGTTESPEWRKGPSGTQSLCNACGLRHSKRMKKLAQFAGERRSEDPEQESD